MPESNNMTNSEFSSRSVSPETFIISNDQALFPELDSNEVRLRCFSVGFNNLFAVGKTFSSIPDLRQKAVEFGRDHNVMITTYSSSLKERKITLQCKHVHEYRAAKKTAPVPVSGDDTAPVSSGHKSRATASSRSNYPMTIVARRNEFDMLVIKKSDSAHNHPIAIDARTYAGFRQMEPENLNTAIALLKKHSPAAVLKVSLIVECVRIRNVSFKPQYNKDND